ncbi:biotin/lipoyl-binding protein [Paenibacillus sp.]|uniref:efflux RND transporter periplasmic adaptor subunit n=1 Tax=Paenibacillus sp. TaxID=58172 RepID=UPI002812566C|nr:biotin/lipoyl-binding protein [Paenibacillus sp.]
MSNNKANGNVAPRRGGGRPERAHHGRRIAQQSKRVAGLAILLSASVAASGCSLLPSEEQPLKPPLVKPAEARIVTAEPKIGTIERALSGSGTFESVRTAYHRFTETGGRVEEVLVRSGDEVKAGDVLLRLDTGEMRMTLLQRRLEVEKKKLALDEAKETGDARRVNIAELELEIATMAYDSIENTFDHRELRSEIDGVVTFAADLEPGDFVEEYRTLFTVSDPSEMRLAFGVSSGSAVSEAQVGMAADIVFKDKNYAGKVVQTPSSAPFEEDERLRDRYSKTLYIEVEGLPEEAEIGDSASVRIITARSEDTLILPKSGVRKLFGRTFVQVIEGESRRELDVETGLETATEVEIVNGLEAGAKVVLQ